MNKPTPHIIDLRQPAKDIVRQVLLAQEPVVLLPAGILHRAIVRAIESEAGFSYAPNFPMTQDASDVMVFYGFSESTQWSMLEEIGLSALICDKKWANLVELWSAGDSGNVAVSPNTKPLDKSYVGIFSSGSTGQAKCIWNRLEHLKLNAMRSAKAFEVQSEHFLVFMALPWHVAGLTWAFMAEELKAEYLFVTTRKGQQALWLQTLQEFRPDYLFTVPSVLRQLYSESWFVPKVVYGGQAISAAEYLALSTHCSQTYQGYGQTEAGGLISVYKRKSTVLLDPGEERCQGFAIEGAHIECEGTPETPQPIWLQSETAHVAQKYATGDIGFMDHDGRIHVLDRPVDKGMLS